MAPRQRSGLLRRGRCRDRNAFLDVFSAAVANYPPIASSTSLPDLAPMGFAPARFGQLHCVARARPETRFGRKKSACAPPQSPGLAPSFSRTKTYLAVQHIDQNLSPLRTSHWRTTIPPANNSVYLDDQIISDRQQSTCNGRRARGGKLLQTSETQHQARK